MATENNRQHQKEDLSLHLDPEDEVDELTSDFEDLELDNSDYEDDLAVVSDLFHQISQDNYAPESAAEESYLAAATASREKEKEERIKQHPSRNYKPLSSSIANYQFWPWQPAVKRMPKSWLIVAATGILAVLFGSLFWANYYLKPSNTLSASKTPAATSPSDRSGQANFSSLETKQVVALTQTNFRQGDVKTAAGGVEELLDRQAWSEAEVALAVVPQQLLDTPAVSFLRGRLAWQQFSTGRKKFSLNDARRFWETAVKKQPHTPLYLNALGFVYYAEGNFNQAIAVWFDALSSGEQQLTQNRDLATQKYVLNSYAGLALALSQLAAKEPGDRGQTLLQEALKLRQKVLKEAASSFQPEVLQKDWMWSKSMIQDWRSLLDLEK